MRLFKRWLLAAVVAFITFLASLYGATNFYIRHYGGAGFERASGANVAAIVVGFGVAIPAAVIVFLLGLYFFIRGRNSKQFEVYGSQLTVSHYFFFAVELTATVKSESAMTPL